MQFNTALEYINWIDEQSGESWSDDTSQLSDVMEDYARMYHKKRMEELTQISNDGSFISKLEEEIKKYHTVFDSLIERAENNMIEENSPEWEKVDEIKKQIIALIKLEKINQ